jgi:hypothetical protein
MVQVSTSDFFDVTNMVAMLLLRMVLMMMMMMMIGHGSQADTAHIPSGCRLAQIEFGGILESIVHVPGHAI